MGNNKVTLPVMVLVLLLFLGSTYAFGEKREVDRRKISALKQESDSSEETSETFIFENVELRFYEDSDWPYLHDIIVNNTEKDIAELAYCMLAYDKEGQPLALQWHIMDSGDKPAYDCVFEDKINIPSGEKLDVYGGWSLYDGEKMKNWPEIGDGGPNKVAYALYCAKQITFSDGSVWENPSYESWLDTYKGKAAEVAFLQSYYPFEQSVLLR